MTYEIFNEDSLEDMKQLPNNSVDCIIDDLPYGVTCTPFDNRLPFAPMGQNFRRVLKKNGAAVLFCQQPFTSELIMSNASNSNT